MSNFDHKKTASRAVLTGLPGLPFAKLNGASRGGYVAMLHLFAEHGPFEPEAGAAMSEAYEAALRELHDTGQPQLVLEVIAGRIIATAKLGERDPHRLREAALAGMPRELT